MSSQHCYKKVIAKPRPIVAPKPSTVVELVKRYGDDWSLMADMSAFGWAQSKNTQTDKPHDRDDAALMRMMERGEWCRCAE